MVEVDGHIRYGGGQEASADALEVPNIVDNHLAGVMNCMAHEMVGDVLVGVPGAVHVQCRYGELLQAADGRCYAIRVMAEVAGAGVVVAVVRHSQLLVAKVPPRAAEALGAVALEVIALEAAVTLQWLEATLHAQAARRRH